MENFINTTPEELRRQSTHKLTQNADFLHIRPPFPPYFNVKERIDELIYRDTPKKIFDAWNSEPKYVKDHYEKIAMDIEGVKEKILIILNLFSDKTVEISNYIKLQHLQRVGFHPNIARIHGAVKDPILGHQSTQENYEIRNKTQYIGKNTSLAINFHALLFERNYHC
ncbi:6653_t:CDS:2 [Scutellospora calospora]|uniref:6653_t:CDS:1 n=1 Tax=Scutellospora calospora TaxID=85575 RepID=A0ACA9LKI3_9GLOM|nr:6653_t:CDS:2 [Scutellospora calospora]